MTIFEENCAYMFMTSALRNSLFFRKKFLCKKNE